MAPRELDIPSNYSMAIAYCSELNLSRTQHGSIVKQRSNAVDPEFINLVDD